MFSAPPSVPPQLRCGGRILDLSEPRVMAVVNVTPDSFSDAGALQQQGILSLDKLLARVQQACDEGAAIIDIGGESTRPGATPVSEQQECDRVLPAVEAVANRFDVLISVDSSTASVISAAVPLGAGLINDVRALTRPGALAAAAAAQVPVCLMHMQGEPSTMQQTPRYRDIVTEVLDFLLARAADCRAAGMADDQLLLDPGFGFGKSLQHNLTLFRALPRFAQIGYPLLVGVSRKSMLGAITGRPVDQRMAASVVMAALAIERGAHIIRAHDIKETVDALRLARAVIDDGIQ